MAAVETLEVRFQANIGSLSASISYLIGRIGSLNAAAISARAAIGNLGAGASLSLIRLNGAAQNSARRQTKLASRLKNTSRALRGVAASAKAATDGIGLHRLDEVNQWQRRREIGEGRDRGDRGYLGEDRTVHAARGRGLQGYDRQLFGRVSEGG